MDRDDYVEEGLRQLSDYNHYELLEEYPTQNYNNQIYQVLQQAANLEIIDDKVKKHYTIKHLESQTFTCYPKYSKLENLEDP